jgi:dipeptidase D
MKKLQNNLGKPEKFWQYFQEITQIPRCSKHEEKIREYMRKKADKFGFRHKVDKAGNLYIYLFDERYGKTNSVVLQAHLDMVCEKNENIEFDFKNDALNLELIETEEKRWVSARGTTLGADNGVGLAYILFLMDQIVSKKFKTEKLNLVCLCTVDEESGLQGAFNVDPSFISNPAFLINLDSEEDDAFTIGCAGGINTIGKVSIDYDNINHNLKKGRESISLSVSGLRGGHSGVDINKGRANAIKIISKILWKINNRNEIYLNSIEGGNRPNAIPREAKSLFFFKSEAKKEIIDYLKEIISEIETGIGEIEPDMKISYEINQESKKVLFFPDRIQNQLLHLLYICLNGVISMHPKIDGLVYTSTNLASIKSSKNSLIITTSQRSMHSISKRIIYEKMEALFHLADIGFSIHHKGKYPGWTPNFDSTLLKVAKDTYRDLFGQEVKVRAIHAGLECGILKDRFPEAEMISIGPQIENPHSPDEKLKVESVEKMWNFINKLLKNLVS